MFVSSYIMEICIFMLIFMSVLSMEILRDSTEYLLLLGTYGILYIYEIHTLKLYDGRTGNF